METGRSLGCPGGGWGDKGGFTASFRVALGRGLTSLGKRRRPEPEPLEEEAEGEMEELGPPAVRNQPEPQEQRSGLVSAKGHCRVQGQGHPWAMVVWEGIKDDLSVLCSF